MKALLINSLTSGGAERIVLNIYRNIRDKQKDIILICLSDKNVYELFKGDHIINLSSANFNDRGFKMAKVFLFPIILYRLYKVIKTHKIDTVQSHLFLASVVNVLTKRIFRLKYELQIVSHMYVSYEKGFKLGGSIKLGILKYVYNRANLLISISEKMKMDINNNLVYKRGIVHEIIQNPHDIEEIVAKSKIDCKFNFNPDKIYLVTCGRIVKRKRIDILIKAIAELTGRNDIFELLIIGDGEEKVVLERLTEQIGVASRVHFIGHVTNPFNYIARSQFFVLTSESEGLPNVIIESMLCKTLVISTDCPTGPRELLAPFSDLNFQLKEGFEMGDHGFLIPINDHYAIVKVIDFCLSNKELKEDIIEKAFRFSNTFSLESKLIEYERVLRFNS